MRLKNRVFEILEMAAPGDSFSRKFDIFIMTLISLNVIAVMLETVENLSVRYSDVFGVFEIFSVSIFTIEYTFRLWTCTIDHRYNRPIWGRIKFAMTPLALVDFIAIIPFYLPMIFQIDLRFIRVLRLFRLFRLFKIGRYSNALKTLGNILKEKKEELLIAVFAVSVLLIVASGLMYFIENKVQPEDFSSIPAAMWWGVSTLTTVGYGDIYPITPLGKLLGAIISILGIGLFALPAGILASGFAEEIQKDRKSNITCPYCGKRIN